jgi:hypothetical protein
MTIDDSQTLLRKLMFNISTLEDLGNVISSAETFEKRVRTALFSVMGALPVSRGGLFLYDNRQNGGRLVLSASRGVELEPGLSIPLPKEIRDSLVAGNRPIFLQDPPPFMEKYLHEQRFVFEGMKTVALQALTFKREFMGLITLGEKFNGEEFTIPDMELLRIMANYTSVGLHNQNLFDNLEKSNTVLRRKVVENSRLYADLQDIYVDTVKALGSAIDAKDPYTRGHSDRVARFSVAVGRRMGLSKDEICALNLASHLHDIGKLVIDNSILCKPDRLNDEEFHQIHRHPIVSYDILSNIRFPYKEVALLTKHHHERVNGSGYPDGRKGDDMSLGMKILSLTDAFDAMTSDRPYRPALSLDDALSEIVRCVCEQFDPGVANTFLTLLKDEVGDGPSPGGIIDGMDMKYEAEALLPTLDDLLRRIPGVTTV